MPRSQTIWFIRHGQAEHNVTKDSSVRDPPLTAIGENQARELKDVPLLQEATSADESVRAQLIVVSPLRRTLQTATIGFGDVKPGIPFLANPGIQEIGNNPCDTGSLPSKMQPLFPAVSFEGVADDWFDKPSPWDKATKTPKEEGFKVLKDRLAEFTTWLGKRAEERIIVVTHHGCICHLLGVELYNCEAVKVQLCDGKWSVVGTSGDLVDVLDKLGSPVTHKGSRPLRSCSQSILKLHGEEWAKKSMEASPGGKLTSLGSPGENQAHHIGHQSMRLDPVPEKRPSSAQQPTTQMPGWLAASLALGAVMVVAGLVVRHRTRV